MLCFPSFPPFNPVIVTSIQPKNQVENELKTRGTTVLLEKEWFNSVLPKDKEWYCKEKLQIMEETKNFEMESWDEGYRALVSEFRVKSNQNRMYGK